MKSAAQLTYSELCFYTLSKQDDAFIHQHVVDVWTAQIADAETKPISLVFALAGLYLLVEKQYTGRQVQKVHLQMAKNKKDWPAIVLPADRGDIAVADVLNIKPGAERDKMINNWCKSVWDSYAVNRKTIVDLLADYNL